MGGEMTYTHDELRDTAEALDRLMRDVVPMLRYAAEDREATERTAGDAMTPVQMIDELYALAKDALAAKDAEIARLTIERDKARDAHAALCPYNAALAAERVKAQWQPIETAPKDGTVILRPHVIWGAMDVRYNVKGLPVTALTAGVNWEWLNGDYTTAWPDTAFHPWWMPLPSPPALGLTGEEPR